MSKKLPLKIKDNPLFVKRFLVFDINNTHSSQFFDTYEDAGVYCIEKGLSLFLEVGDVCYKNAQTLSISPVNFYFVQARSSTIYMIDVNDFNEISKEMLADKVFFPYQSNYLN
ncbi:hypothetical protein [Arsenophonus nasoniae]|uniref:Uncharacterized protein n=1 Tax=Arsenophonus nasoniae TaxID=638 RepID=A0AA95K154_9GAMM|nr:hypothetical protein [Arsenophonus nasoniae]WGL96239.1 hypothetical protein QE207_06605 [Arsenophonus nasoniae]